VTNVAADHLDWFAGDMAAYVATKCKVGDAMGPGDALLVNGDDPELAPHRARLARSALDFATFSTQRVPDKGLGLHAETLWWSLASGVCVPLVPAAELGRDGAFPIVGIHNVENALAAAGLALAFGPAGEASAVAAVKKGLRDFSLPSHRIEPVAAIGAVRFVDDSKATNPHAAMAGVASVALAAGDKLVWIAGGSDKGADFNELGRAVAQRASAAILIGQTAGKIAATLPEGVPVHRCERLEDAVALGWELAQPAGVVLLSPACASFDMFKSYAHRGEVFAGAVRRLGEAVGRGR
jgi:UDP-N-acetylmuramoylalanine--D-glutamate ligase